MSRYRWMVALGAAWSLALLLRLGTIALADEPGTVSNTDLGWRTYHSDAGGFSVSVPENWVTDEQTRSDGAVVISLTAPDGTGGVMIVAQANLGSNLADDLPNTLCQPITVGGLPGTRCLDTLASSSSIAVPVSDRMYQIFASERRLGSDIYGRVVASFSFDQAAVSPATTQPQASGLTTVAPAIPPPYDCALGTGLGRVKPLCALP